MLPNIYIITLFFVTSENQDLFIYLLKFWCVFVHLTTLTVILSSIFLWRMWAVHCYFYLFVVAIQRKQVTQNQLSNPQEYINSLSSSEKEELAI